MEIKDCVTIKGTFLIEDRDAVTGELIRTQTIENGWPTVGWNEILKLITGASTSAFSTANTVIGAGDSSTAFNAADTDLKAATNKTYKAVTSGFPTTPTVGTLQFSAVFYSSEGNHAWEEVVVKNTVSGVIWNRAVSSIGVKTSSLSRTVTVTLGKT